MIAGFARRYRRRALALLFEIDQRLIGPANITLRHHGEARYPSAYNIAGMARHPSGRAAIPRLRALRPPSKQEGRPEEERGVQCPNLR